MSQYKLVRFNLNGKDVEKMVDVRASLTDMLRNDYHMTSVKKGCEVGECGACNVIIDGEAFNSCIYLAVWADGKHIRTLESLMGEDGELSDIQQAFLEEAAVQCGFCTPGFIMTAVEILESGKLYSEYSADCYSVRRYKFFRERESNLFPGKNTDCNDRLLHKVLHFVFSE